MQREPPISTRTVTLFPFTPLFRSYRSASRCASRTAGTAALHPSTGEANEVSRLRQREPRHGRPPAHRDRLLPPVPRHLARPRRTRPPHRTRRTGRAGDAARATAVPRRPPTPRRPPPRLQAGLPQEEAEVPARGAVRHLTRPTAPAPARAPYPPHPTPPNTHII